MRLSIHPLPSFLAVVLAIASLSLHAQSSGEVMPRPASNIVSTGSLMLDGGLRIDSGLFEAAA